MFTASRRVTMPNVQSVDSHRRPSQFHRAVRRHYASTEPSFTESKLASTICQQIYWAFRSVQYMLCFRHIGMVFCLHICWDIRSSVVYCRLYSTLDCTVCCCRLHCIAMFVDCTVHC